MTSTDSVAWLDPAVFEDVAGGLVLSVEPAVVFASLASAAVPVLAQKCSIAVRDERGGAFAIRRPSGGERTSAGPVPTTRGTTIRAGALQAGCLGHPGYAVSAWFVSDVGAAPDTVAAVEILATSLVDRATGLVHRARLEAALEQARTKTLNLTKALESNRVIAEAVGILMASRRLTDEQSFDLLRNTSRRRRRKLHELAEDVARTGELEEGGIHLPSVSRGNSPKASR